MADGSGASAELPARQQAIRARCRHPSGRFVPFEHAALEQSVAGRFEQQAALHPDRVAVKTGGGLWTYADLNRAANRLARAILAQQGPGSEPVGLLFPNGANAFTAIMATLKAGKFYVPLDPTFPHARLAAILDDAGARLLVTDTPDHPLAVELAAGGVRVLDGAAPDAGLSAENPTAAASPADLACLFYTSGSTGRPKGVMQSHRSLLHWVMTHTNELRITPDDRLTLLHSWSVPSCVHPVLGALLNGAALLPFDLRADGAPDLCRWLHAEAITIYHSVPAVFRQLSSLHQPTPQAGEEGERGKKHFPDLRAIVLSSAPMSCDDLELYRRHFAPHSVLLHMIGASEVGWFRRYFIDESPLTGGLAVPVGYAVVDKEVVLLDESGVPVADGADGEIAVKSRYLALGYWQQAELTAQKFAPVLGAGGERIYRTGDLGRMQSDGCLVHLGRADFQVKVRGHRVEIAEVERALLACPGVAEVAAVGRSVAGDTRLVAYVVPAAGCLPTVTELRRQLADRLPAYMIPAAFVRLAALPSTPNGKLDFAALPEPGGVRPDLTTAYRPPETEIERAVTLAWQEVLGIEQVGMHDNFFDLGGDSSLLTNLNARLMRDLRREIPLLAMFEHPTVDALLAYLFPSRRASAGSLRSLPRERATSREGEDGEHVSALRAGRDRLAELAQRQRARETE